MSDVSQGQGWWLASDGKWYPPELNPSPLPPPPPPVVAPTPAVPPRAKRKEDESLTAYERQSLEHQRLTALRLRAFGIGAALLIVGYIILHAH